MFEYSIGQVIEEFRGHQECTLFDVDDNGAVILVFFDNPTKDEIDQFKSDKSFEIRMTQIRGLTMITAQIGNLNWMDAPYNVHLSKNLTKFPLPQEKQGLALTLMLINSATGEIKHIRVMGLSERFSRELIGTIMEEKMSPFDPKEHEAKINKVYAVYSTKQIVDMSKCYCKIRQGSYYGK